MTPAITLLDELGLSYQLHQYQHEAATVSYGQEAVDKLGVPAERVFKTLLIESNNRETAVAVIPVAHQLKLKAVAKHMKCKKVTMVDKQQVQNRTGYIVGAVSPVGQSHRYLTLIDDSAHDHDSIYISAGRRGLELEIAPAVLEEVCEASFVSLI